MTATMIFQSKPLFFVRLLLLTASIIALTSAFVVTPPPHHHHQLPQRSRAVSHPQRRYHKLSFKFTTTTTTSSSSPTALHLLLDVPDGFFTVTFPMLGILLSISKNFARIRMEENAWEQRFAEARQERLEQDPTLTELDVRRQEAALEWSAYGEPAKLEEQRAHDAKEKDRSVSRRRQGRVRVMDRDDDDDDEEDDPLVDPRSYRMTSDEIAAFELEYGIPYDPYYDDPYEEDELPEGSYSVDRMYGDRIYDNGEIFYKDKQTGLFYRQGCKPRNLSFWK